MVIVADAPTLLVSEELLRVRNFYQEINTLLAKEQNRKHCYSFG